MKEKLRNLPKVDTVLERADVKQLMNTYPRWVVVEALRKILEEKRRILLEGIDTEMSEEGVARELLTNIDRFALPSLRKVINATGVVLHTNLGRAPLSEEAIDAIREVALRYSNLEYDINLGKRGLRYVHVVDILRKITGCEDALVVNNNASAVFLVLNTLAKGKEVIVSRGELIEIGGSFRIPDVMRSAGAILREVGTTNKTKISDYKDAINENTALILKVHTSNYKIVGFTESVPLKELVKLGREYGLPVYEDLGSGLFVDVRKFGLPYEPTVQESLRAGVDVVSFSGDKLLGATQAGIILGKKEILEPIKRNPMNRALRIDKLTLAALEATFRIYMEDEDSFIKKIPVLQMLSQDMTTLKKRAEYVVSNLNGIANYQFSIVEDVSTVGGGALPTAELPTCCVAVDGSEPPEATEEKLRKRPKIPVIARIKKDRVLMDMRTVRDSEVDLLIQMVKEALQ
ncbi:L-seryl-tRNA(Sec) selenium transferase [Thermosulfidibacter takaii]|uniref:L-seryl-tRNA(Sec) selenium transferase n=1 Tax=Thermosulfidibacter takaii TaxID=412593 RepID=UPI000838EA1D|nr:L-seryl-tRNA(Sec) selenium transferase [Thermosulfidibacter takaii]